MSKFISVVKFLFGVCMSLLIMAAGVHFTYMYYMTMAPVHDVFAVVGPLFIAFAFCTAFLVIYELVQELRSEARVRAFVAEHERLHRLHREIVAHDRLLREGNAAVIERINSELEESNNA